MTDRLEEVAREYREALDQEAEAKRALDAARDRKTAAALRVAEARQPLAEAIIQAAREGTRQVEIVKITGYNRERVRQICRAAGLEPGE